MALTDSSSNTTLLGDYPTTLVSQRANSIQATSFLSASSNATIGSNIANFFVEVANTLNALGYWKGAA